MAAIFEQMRSIGVDFGLICANTPHRALPIVESGTRLPILSIIDATADAITKAGMKTVALLGTKFTMKEDFYKKGLSERGITAVVPNDNEMEAVNRVIYEELVKGIIKDESRGVGEGGHRAARRRGRAGRYPRLHGAAAVDRAKGPDRPGVRHDADTRGGGAEQSAGVGITKDTWKLPGSS